MLRPRATATTDDPAAAFLGHEEPDHHLPALELLHAMGGEEACALLEREAHLTRPIAVAYVDIRMPPGIDGVATVRNIRRFDRAIEIVLMTAYTDTPLADIVQDMELLHKLLYIRKPFAREEIQADHPGAGREVERGAGAGGAAPTADRHQPAADGGTRLHRRGDRRLGRRAAPVVRQSLLSTPDGRHRGGDESTDPAAGGCALGNADAQGPADRRGQFSSRPRRAESSWNRWQRRSPLERRGKRRLAACIFGSRGPCTMTGER